MWTGPLKFLFSYWDVMALRIMDQVLEESENYKRSFENKRVQSLDLTKCVFLEIR